MVLVGRPAVPLDRLGVVLGHPETGVVAEPQGVLGAGVVLVGGQPVPARGAPVVLRDAGAGHVEAGEVELRRRIARLGPGAQFADVPLGLRGRREQRRARADDEPQKQRMPAHDSIPQRGSARCRRCPRLPRR